MKKKKILRALQRFIRAPIITRLELYRGANQMGLFNRNWYEQTYHKVFATRWQAFGHYLRVSRFSNIHPSLQFDGEFYARTNTDVYESATSPLAHYIRWGARERRPTARVATRWQPRNCQKYSTDLSLAAARLRIAIVLHIHYADYIRKFFDALRDFPTEFDLFIAVGPDVSPGQAQRIFRDLPNARQITVRTTPNRGRNFGPLLVEFGVALRNYDLFCHLHSKKSLFSGREQYQWADYLLEYLLRDREVVSQALNAFAKDPTVGVYYPTSFWMLPCWVNHWTRNKRFVPELPGGSSLNTTEDFINYPVGGMFWARPAALEAMLGAGMSYDDLPPEPVPPDGTALHALERSVGLMAEARGLRQLYYYPPTGTFTFDGSYCFAHYASSVGKLLEELSPYRIVSFDLFDTLVRRQYQAPDYAKLKLGQRLATEGLVTDAPAFVAMRNETESELRKARKFRGDVGLAEIWATLAQKLNLPAERATDLCEREFLLDLEMILPKDEMVDLFHALATSQRALWITTDTYYSRTHIERILGRAGIYGASRVLVSSELQMRKDNLSLWRHIKQTLTGKELTGFVHVGDNVVSDSQLPGDLGLRTIHILHPLDKWDALGYPSVLRGEKALDEREILKWGPMVSKVGRNPFLGE